MNPLLAVGILVLLAAVGATITWWATRPRKWDQ